MGDWFLDLEVDVNGEEIFLVNKTVISSYSGRISKLIFGKSKGAPRCLKVVFNNFPGGAANFENVVRFCYGNGKVDINPLNISRLTCAAHFMEMNKYISGTENLCEITLEEVKYWSWSELLMALKQCQSQEVAYSCMTIVDKCMDSLISRIIASSSSSSCEISPCPSVSSSDSSTGIRLSCDTDNSKKSSCFRTTWWFEDLVAFDAHIIHKLVKMMVSKSFDHGIISKFVFYYQKTRFYSASVDEKSDIVEMIVEMLESLDIRSVSHKSLFELLNVRLRQQCRDRMEHMIGSQLDEATLDSLLIPSPVKTRYMYDVDLVLRLVKSFLSCCVALRRLKKVARVVDLYLAEVAPDPYLKASKFLALVKALPDSARDCYDDVYNAVDLYVEVHWGVLSEEEKMNVCIGGINYEKLSYGAMKQVAENPKFPSRAGVHAAATQRRKLKSLLEDEQVVIISEKEMLKAQLQGMQWRVMELEKVCRKMQAKITRPSRHKSVPKLCS